MTTRMQFYNIVLGAILLILSCTSSPPLFIEGVYGSISESEWDLTITFYPDGSAQIQLEQWLAGQYKQRDIKTIKGTWSKDDNKVLLRYDKIVDTLIYTNNLSLEELDLPNGAPGLMQVPPIDPKSIINGVKLWKKPHNFLKQGRK